MKVSQIRRLEELESFIKENEATVCYFSTQDCNVCKVLKPKLIDFLEEKFPKIKFSYIDLNEAKEISGQLGILAVPTIIFHFEGKEFLRKSRNINFHELEDQLTRIYNLIFD
ncbi:MAG: thioredoxin [Ignavibacteria bacterium]|nr:MAG: thioredoxin [Ignavibacteria bacterium]